MKSRWQQILKSMNANKNRSVLRLQSVRSGSDESIYTAQSSEAGRPLPYQALSGRAFTLGIPSIRLKRPFPFGLAISGFGYVHAQFRDITLKVCVLNFGETTVLKVL